MLQFLFMLISFAVTHLPQIISLVQDIIALIGKLHQSDPVAAQGAVEALKGAVADAKALTKAGDKAGAQSKLQKLRDELKDCVGEYCEADVQTKQGLRSKIGSPADLVGQSD